MVRTVRVGEAPPSVQLAECEVHPAEASEVLERHQLSRGCEQGAAVRQGLLKETGGVQHVGSDQEIVAVGVETLSDGGLLDVERTVHDRSTAVPESSLRFGKEARRDVCVRVVEPTLGKLGEHRRSSRSRTRPDLDHPEPPSVGQFGYQSLYRVCQHPVRSTGHRRLQVQIGRRRFSAAEKQRKWVLLTAEHITEGETGPLEQPNLREAIGVQARHAGGELLEVSRQDFRQRVPWADDHYKVATGLL